jgi:hypothetical protein
MLTLEDAFLIASKKLDEFNIGSNTKLAMMKEFTREFEYGWMFFYQSEEYLKTKNLDHLVGGNAPFIVDKFNGSLHVTGTGKEENFYIEQYCKYRENIQLFEDLIRR